MTSRVECMQARGPVPNYILPLGLLFCCFFVTQQCMLLFLLCTDDNPRFAEYFQEHLKTIAAEFFTLLVFCYRDGFDGVEQVVRNRAVSSTAKYFVSHGHVQYALHICRCSGQHCYYCGCHTVLLSTW